MLEERDYVDDIALLSLRLSELQEKTEKKADEEARAGLKNNATKC